MSGMRSHAVLRRLSPVAAFVLVAVSLVAVNGARGDGVAAASTPAPPLPSGSTPNTSPHPPSVPGNVRATATSTSVTLTWTASTPGCCAVAGYTVMYHQAFNDIVWAHDAGNVTSVTFTTNIRPASQYSFRVVARDGLGHNSLSSETVTVVTPLSDSGPDTVPPGTPTGLQAGPAGTTTTLTWSPATDNVGVTGYDVYRFDGLFVSTRLATVAGTTYTAPLTGTRNFFYVRARDAAGNVSIASNLVTVNSTVTASPSVSASPSAPVLSCRVTFAVNAQWAGGFVAGITITNTGTTPITDWVLTFTFGGDQRITQAWNATATQTGAAATITHAAWNRVIPPGGSVSLGLQGTWTGSLAPPTAFYVNGVRCTG